MKPVTHSITINAPKQKVWRVLTEHPFVDEWTGGYMDGSTVKGEFGLGEKISYQSPEGGVKVVVKEFLPGERLVTVVNANLKPDGQDLQEGDEGYEDSKEWIGSTDAYELTEEDGKTTLTITTHYPETFDESTHSSAQSESFSKLKDLAESV